MANRSKLDNLFLIYTLSFLVSFGAALMAYIDSSFLSTFLPEKYVGSVYTVAYIFLIICFLLMPYVLKRFGNFKTSLSLVIIELLALTGIVIFNSPVWIITCLIINLISIPLIYFSIDIFLEGFSSNRQTGILRGVYLTAINLAWVVAQFFNGSLLASGNYKDIYLVSFILIAPIILILVLGLRRFKDSSYQIVSVWQTARSIWKNKNIFNILVANFLLYFFYSWMIIYTPLYLNKTIGLSWMEISLVFSIMLLPFVLLQTPLGYLADKKYGEREMLNIGFIIMAVSTGIIFFINDGNLILWAVVLFFTRVGAAIVEVMCNTYFFKKVDGLNANIISFFRMSGTMAYLFGALFGTLILNLLAVDLKGLFLILSLVMLMGIKFSLALKDTK
jgi:MFS family permease